MADKTASHDIEDGVPVKFRDMGDGSFAEVQIQGSLSNAINNSASAAATQNVATLAGVVLKTTFISGFEVTGTGATASSTIAVVVAGLDGGSATYYLTIPAGVAAALTPPLIVTFSPPIPASAVNTGITVTVPSFGVGNLNAAVNAHGFQQ